MTAAKEAIGEMTTAKEEAKFEGPWLGRFGKPRPNCRRSRYTWLPYKPKRDLIEDMLCCFKLHEVGSAYSSDRTAKPGETVADLRKTLLARRRDGTTVTLSATELADAVGDDRLLAVKPKLLADEQLLWALRTNHIWVRFERPPAPLRIMGQRRNRQTKTAAARLSARREPVGRGLSNKRRLARDGLDSLADWNDGKRDVDRDRQAVVYAETAACDALFGDLFADELPPTQSKDEEAHTTKSASKVAPETADSDGDGAGDGADTPWGDTEDEGDGEAEHMAEADVDDLEVVAPQDD